MKYNLPRLEEAELDADSDTNPTRKRGSPPDFPRLRVGLVALSLTLAALSPLAIAQQPKRSGYGTSRFAARPETKEPSAKPQGRAGEGDSLPSPLTPEEKDGNQLVAIAAKDVFRQKSIQAKVRQHVFAFGQEVAGAGEYYQFGSGQPKLLRLDLKMQIGPQAASLLQVCGRQDYWVRRHVPPTSPKLEHVNLTRLASALSRAKDDGSRVPTENWILLGGLSRLMESLHRNFDFSPPQQSRIGTVPVLLVSGRLKPEQFKALHSPEGSGQDTRAANQIPTSVNLTLGLADQPLPHFPYRIEFLRQLTDKELKSASHGNSEAKPSSETPLCILEFYEVHAPLDFPAELFEFDPGDEESEDRTQTWLRKLVSK